MLSTMMDVPLLVSQLIDYAADHHATTEVVARSLSGEIERENWAGMRARAKRLAKALSASGYGLDDCVASLAWNTSNHLELFYGVLGIGAGLHTLNPRLLADDLRYMIEKVNDKIVFIDGGTLSVAEAVAPLAPRVKAWIFMDEAGELPESSITGLISKSAFTAGFDDTFEWPNFDERQAATICFTSGTTGRPKGVAYSHRSLTLTAMNMSMADMYAGYRPGALECVMPIAPIFHANGWMMPFTAPMNGHKLVLPGRAFDAQSMIELIRTEGVTLAGAVPTVWQDLVDTLVRMGLDVPTLKTGLLSGTRPSQSLLDKLDAQGIQIRQSWGMTEAPGATRGSPPPGSELADTNTRALLHGARQGRVGFQARLKLLDEEGKRLPFDGKNMGRLFVRGPVVTGRYVGDQEESVVDWLDTGDIARIYADGTIEIVDRAKDVIKSGGEWISAVQLEMAAMSHPAIRQAAAIGVHHPRWEERPLLICSLATGATVTAAELSAHMAKSMAKWWLPDQILFVDELPLTATGKLNKLELRRTHNPPAAA